MEELLTVKEVQDLLKVDRITVYRMLKGGRLAGVKVGHQWRFQEHDIDALLTVSLPSPGDAVYPPGPAPFLSSSPSPAAPTSAPHPLPLHCVEMIQNVFAEVAQIGAVTTSPQGQPLTRISNSCQFCELVRSSEEGRRGCQASWQRLSEQVDPQPTFATCHAGLQYARARIELESEPVAMLVAGQFYAEPPDPDEEATRITQLAEKYGLDAEALSETAKDLPVLDERKRAQIGKWLQSVAHTFEDIGRERAELMGRLRTIAAMSTLDTV